MAVQSVESVRKTKVRDPALASYPLHLILCVVLLSSPQLELVILIWHTVPHPAHLHTLFLPPYRE